MRTETRPDGTHRSSEQGMAMVTSLFLVLALALLGLTSVHLVGQELQASSAVRDQAALLHLAEAGADLIVARIHASGGTGPDPVSGALARRNTTPARGPSYFDALGRSQFIGTADHPDLLLDAADPQHDAWLNDAAFGRDPSLRSLGRILRLKLYGPLRPGLVCTVEVTAAKSRERPVPSSTVQIQLGAVEIPPLRAGAQVAEIASSSNPQLPLLVHWGDLNVRGAAWIGSIDEIPQKTILAPLSGQSYAEMRTPEDRWHEMKIGGTLLSARPSVRGATLPANVYQRQEPIPGIAIDQWGYEELKQVAKTFGVYYGVDREGLLYPGGAIESGQGLTIDQVMGSDFVGDHKGLVFVDTLDQQAPRTDNLPTFIATTPYAEGIFIIHGHLQVKPTGSGKSIPALSPPAAGQAALVTRAPAQLGGINLNGVLYTTGNLLVQASAKIYGAVVVQGTVKADESPGNTLEVWYNHELRQGFYRGIPVLHAAPGTWKTL
ncbi:MAG: hypothetical protein AB7N95_16315 [Nitrospiraceae bacterium]